LYTGEEVHFNITNGEHTRRFSVEDWLEGSSKYEINAINIAASIITENSSSQQELLNHKVLVRVINLLGQDVTQFYTNMREGVYFKVYDDGTIEKVVY